MKVRHLSESSVATTIVRGVNDGSSSGGQSPRRVRTEKRRRHKCSFCAVRRCSQCFRDHIVRCARRKLSLGARKEIAASINPEKAPGQLYVCGLCPLSFAKRKELTGHTQEAHVKVVPPSKLRLKGTIGFNRFGTAQLKDFKLIRVARAPPKDRRENSHLVGTLRYDVPTNENNGQPPTFTKETRVAFFCPVCGLILPCMDDITWHIRSDHALYYRDNAWSLLNQTKEIKSKDELPSLKPSTDVTQKMKKCSIVLKRLDPKRLPGSSSQPINQNGHNTNKSLDKKLHVCPKCDEEFRSKAVLKNHDCAYLPSRENQNRSKNKRRMRKRKRNPNSGGSNSSHTGTEANSVNENSRQGNHASIRCGSCGKRQINVNEHCRKEHPDSLNTEQNSSPDPDLISVV